MRMSLRTLFTFISLIPVSVMGQSISVSPISFKAWGTTPAMSELAVTYEDIGVHYFHAWGDHYYMLHETPLKTTSAWAISYTPVRLKDAFKGGIIIADREFPIERGSFFNFLLDIGFDVRYFRISYQHISNGFGLLNPINPGIDTIKMTVKL